MEFLGILCLILITTKLAGSYCNHIKIPSVIGELLVGIILGPAVLSILHPSEFISYFAEIGVVFLMFIAGMESDFSLLKKYWKPGLSVALFGIIFPLVFCYLVAIAFDLGVETAVFLGVLFSATSVSISVEVLKELKHLETKEGATILVAAVADDIMVVLLVSIMVTLFHDSTDVTTNHSILLTIVKKIAFFAIVYSLSKWIVPRLLSFSTRMLAIESEASMAIIICLGYAYLADTLGMGSIIGAFFAGIALSQTEYKHKLEEKIEPISYAAFIPVFFVSIGLNMNFDSFTEQWLLITTLVTVATLTKLLGGAMGAKITNFSWQSSFVIGSGMVSRGEMALIIAALGLELGLLPATYYSSIIMVIILTTILAPFLLKYTITKQEKQDLLF